MKHATQKRGLDFRRAGAFTMPVVNQFWDFAFFFHFNEKKQGNEDEISAHDTIKHKLCRNSHAIIFEV